MTQVTATLTLTEYQYLLEDFPCKDETTLSSVFLWLVGEHEDYFPILTESQQVEVKQTLRRLQSYLELHPMQAYRHLIRRLSYLVLQPQSFRHFVKQHHEQSKVLVNLIQTIIQNLTETDSYLQQKIDLITDYTQDQPLREAFYLATLERYCLDCVDNKPRLLHYFLPTLKFCA